jgi:hypothetical protein
MPRFRPLAALLSNRPLPQTLPHRRSPTFKRGPKHPRPLPSRLQQRRMAPERTGGTFQKVSATGLRHARCLFHPLREAAARCPHCGGTFCRECVTDEEGKLACPPCLRRFARPPAPKASLARLFREVLAGLTAFACLAAFFFGLLRWRMNTPEQHLNLGRVVGDRLAGQSHE